MSDTNIEWERIEPTVVTKVGWRTVTTKTFRMPDGSIMTWDTKDPEGSQAAAVIALTPDNHAVIAYQYRPGMEDFMYELPGGGADPGEDPQVAAERELYEETGYRAAAVEYLGKVYKDAHCNTTWHFYLATGCQNNGGEKYKEPGEFTDVRLISIAQLFAYAREGRMTDSEAVFLAYEKLKKIQEEL